MRVSNLRRWPARCRSCAAETDWLLHGRGVRNAERASSRNFIRTAVLAGGIFLARIAFHARRHHPDMITRRKHCQHLTLLDRVSLRQHTISQLDRLFGRSPSASCCGNSRKSPSSTCDLHGAFGACLRGINGAADGCVRCAGIDAPTTTLANDPTLFTLTPRSTLVDAFAAAIPEWPTSIFNELIDFAKLFDNVAFGELPAEGDRC